MSSIPDPNKAQGPPRKPVAQANGKSPKNGEAAGRYALLAESKCNTEGAELTGLRNASQKKIVTELSESEQLKIQRASAGVDGIERTKPPSNED